MTGALLGLGLGLGLLLMLTARRPVAGTSSASRWLARRTDMLRQAGVRGVTGGQLLALQVLAGLVVGAAVLVLSRSVSVAVCFLVFASFAPTALVKRMQAKRQLELREVWPEVVDNLASAVRAGLALPEAVAALSTRGPVPLRDSFARFGSEYRATGRFADCLDGLRDDLADPVADRVCEALRLAREVGGTELGRLLRTLSVFLREESRTRAELETRQGWTVNAARMAVAAPWIVLLLLATDSTTLSAYDTFGGRVLLLVGAVLTFAAYRVMLRIGKLPADRRVLRVEDTTALPAVDPGNGSLLSRLVFRRRSAALSNEGSAS